MNQMSIRGLLLISLVAGVACGKSPKAKETPPCSVGVNEKSCALSIKNSSKWSRTDKVLRGGEGPDRNQVIKKIYVIQEFAQTAETEVQWRRTSTIIQDGVEPQTMFIQGTVVGILNDRLALSITKSSCDGIDKSFHIEKGSPLYYTRSGNSLHLQTQPPVVITPSKSGNPVGNIFASVIGAAVGSVMQATVSAMVDLTLSVMTFGTLRDRLAEGAGTYVAGMRGLEGASPESFSYGKLGCFAGSRGEVGEFKASNSQVFDW